jgi:CBS domain-containing protein
MPPDDEITSEMFVLGGLVAGPPIVVDEATPIAVVRERLCELRVSAVVVVDATRSLRGLVTRTDVLRAHGEMTAGEAMSPFVFALPAVSRIERAAALMAYEEVAQVVVVGCDNELIGLVSAVDIARHVAIVAGFYPDIS